MLCGLLHKRIHNMRCYVAYCINVYIICRYGALAFGYASQRLVVRFPLRVSSAKTRAAIFLLCWLLCILRKRIHNMRCMVYCINVSCRKCVLCPAFGYKMQKMADFCGFLVFFMVKTVFLCPTFDHVMQKKWRIFILNSC